MIRQEEVYRIGRLGKPHGVKGELSFQFSDDVFDRVDADFLVLEIDGILMPFFMEAYRFRSSEVALVKFADVDTEEQARELTGCSVYFPREHAEADTENASWPEIIGYAVVDAGTGQTVGRIADVDTSTVNTLFAVQTDAGGECLIPASDELVTGVDKAARTLTMTIPDGLLSLD